MGCKGVTLPASPQVLSNTGANGDVSALVSLITTLWCTWLAADKKAYVKLCSKDVMRATAWTNATQYGTSGVQSSLPAEWDFFERDYSKAGSPLAGNISILHVEVSITQSVAHAHYWLELWTGKTWPYRITGATYQAFKKSGSGSSATWLLALQADGWWSSWQPTANASLATGVGSWRQDFTYPVSNLSRALAWYRPLLGEPEVAAPGWAAFRLGGPRLVLAASDLQGFAQLRRQLPNGFSTFYPASLDQEVAQLLARDSRAKLLARFSAGADGPDPWAVLADPAGNVFVERERRYSASSTPGAPAPQLLGVQAVLRGSGLPQATLDTVKALLRAWLRADESALARLLDPGCTWYDNTRLHGSWPARGSGAVLQALRQAWAQYDRTSAGLVANMSVANLRALALGSDLVAVTFDRLLSCQGAASSVPPDHWFTQPAHHAHVFRVVTPSSATTSALRLLHTFITEDVSTPQRAGQFVRNLDYTAYPTPALATLEPFYTTAMHMGSPYKDSFWRGWWSQVNVFGIYVTTPKVDKLPQAGLANGYASLWVTSPRQAYNFLAARNTTFLHIPAINDKAGLDNQGTYTTLLVEDSEGNAVVLTGYT